MPWASRGPGTSAGRRACRQTSVGLRSKWLMRTASKVRPTSRSWSGVPVACSGQLGLHHIGVWSDDPSGESARLESLGWPREAVGVAPDGSWAGALFHRGTGGLRVEVVNIATSGPKLIRYLAGGDYSSPPS